MQIFNGHYNVADLIEVNRVTKDEILNLAVKGRVPIAVWADNVFVCPVHYSEQNKRYQKMAQHPRPCNGEWLYVRPKYLPKYKSDREAVNMRLFRSGPQANVDIAASPSPMPISLRGLKISMGELWVPTDSWDLIEEEARNESENAAAFGIAKRVYADILAAHDKNRTLPHPAICSYGRVYSHLARQQAAPPENNAEYWVNDSKRDPDEVSRKLGLGTLAIHYRPEGAKRSTRPLEISWREFMNAFNQIRR